MACPHVNQLRQIRRTIGNNIHTIRTARKMTLKRLSAETQISTHTLDMFEIGRGQVSLESLYIIARALNTDTQQLIKL